MHILADGERRPLAASVPTDNHGELTMEIDEALQNEFVPLWSSAGVVEALGVDAFTASYDLLPFAVIPSGGRLQHRPFGEVGERLAQFVRRPDREEVGD